MSPDQELLGEFARSGSEAAFETLVQRHLNMVFHAALRRVGGDSHAANDVTQKVFTDLARKAPRLTGHPNLAGWLHRGTRFAAAEYVRGERRRRAREEEAHAMNLNDAEALPEAPLHALIDEMLDQLSAKDRTALVMHFFENRTFVEVGEALAISADAARMRVNRALEKTRQRLGNRGLSSSAAMLASALSGASASAHPLPAAHRVTRTALSTASAGGLVGVAGLKIAAWVTGGLVVAVLGAGAWRLRESAEPGPQGPVQSVPAAVADPSPEPVSEMGETPQAATVGALTPSAPTPVRLDVDQRNLMGRLWRAELLHGVPPKIRTGMVLNADSAYFAVAQRLDAMGLTRTTPRGVTVLTPKGLAFCRAHFRNAETNTPPSRDD